jgi:mannose/fructose/N-acetylgalactosamine-specific phosphotransferase system component IIC
VDLAFLVFLGGLLALDGTSVGQFMVSRPLVAGVLTGWAVGDPTTGLLLGGILELYFISVFPVGGADFPEGGPPTLVAVATAVAVPGSAGIALGALMGFLWSRLGGVSIRLRRKINGRLVPDPSEENVSASRVLWAHMGGLALDFFRGSVLSILGLGVGRGLAQVVGDAWPLGMSATLGLLVVGACVPAGAFMESLGGWRRRKTIFAVGLAGFLLGSIFL